MPIYEITWHKDGCVYFDDWFTVELTFEAAMAEFDNLNPCIIAEVEDAPITVKLLEFEVFDRDGKLLSPTDEDFDERWYSDGPRKLLKSKHS